jgi:coproporphyrinogen III oxidase-like Fe-S oxidoreductase
MAAIERVLAFGGFTVSADFILGVPPRGVPETRSESGRRHLGPDWSTITALPIDHLSVYELTIEDRTAFGQRVRTGRLVPLGEDALIDLYVTTHATLSAAGFEHYEISSYARPGKRAVHNSLYWAGAPFLGLGVGAASLSLAPDGSGERATNPRKARDYLAGVPAEVTAIPPAEMAVDRAWLGMRTVDGVVETTLPTELVRWLVDEKLAERKGGRIGPTLSGFLMADRIAARIVQAL